MRLIVMFDLPVETSSDRREYSKFRKHLVKSGFVMLQKSVYTKIAVNPTMGDLISENIRNHKPKAGTVSLLRITEKQYSSMEFILGTKQTEVIDSDERLVII